MSKELSLQEAIGVDNDKQLQKTMTQKGLVAGINFHHARVSIIYFKITNNKGAYDFFLGNKNITTI